MSPLLAPARVASTGISLSLSSGSATIKDDAGSTHSVQLNLSAASANDFDVLFSTYGNGRYDFDWRLLRSTDHSGLRKIVVPAGFTHVPLNFDINENLDVSETYGLQIEESPGYSIGATSAHLITCNRAATKPDATNTGCGDHSALTAWTGGDIGASYSGQTISYKYFDGQVSIRANDVRFDHCWFKGHGGSYAAYLRAGFAGVLFTYCEFGSDGGAGHYNTGAMIYAEGYQDATYRGVRCEWCYFHDYGNDAIKPSGTGWSCESCYFERCGVWEKYGGDPHSDCFGKNDNWKLYAVDLYRCNMYIPQDVILPLGYESNAVFMMNEGVADGIAVRSCWCSGGNVTFNNDDDQGDVVLSNAKIKNCRVDTRLYNPTSGVGAYKFSLTAGSAYVISGCVADDSGSKDPLDSNGQPFNNAPAF